MLKISIRIHVLCTIGLEMFILKKKYVSDFWRRYIQNISLYTKCIVWDFFFICIYCPNSRFYLFWFLKHKNKNRKLTWRQTNLHFVISRTNLVNDVNNIRLLLFFWAYQLINSLSIGLMFLEFQVFAITDEKKLTGIHNLSLYLPKTLGFPLHFNKVLVFSKLNKTNRLIEKAIERQIQLCKPGCFLVPQK